MRSPRRNAIIGGCKFGITNNAVSGICYEQMLMIWKLRSHFLGVTDGRATIHLTGNKERGQVGAK
jgi:hypothetical protein